MNGAIARRLQRAFSLRRNLRYLFVPSGSRLRPLDGIRALSMLWVVLFHCGWYIGGHIPVADYLSLVFSPWMLPVWRGDFSVDVFFVLSGFLIAGMLVDEQERTGEVRLGRFYVRRLLRLWPALCVGVLVYVVFIGQNNGAVWANLLYVSNFIPIVDAAMGWTWSLAMEEQFYLLCPWLVMAVAPLAAQRRVAVIVAVAAVLCFIAGYVVVSGQFTALDSEIVVARDIGRWAIGYDALYVKPWMRFGPLLMGVGSAFVFRNGRAMDALARGVTPILGLLIALVVVGVSLHWPLVWGAPRALEVAFLATYRTLFGAGVAYVILLSVSRNPVGMAIGRVLSSRALYPFGQLSYSAYLLNPVVTMLVQERLIPVAQRWRILPFALLLPVDAIVTFTGAAIVYLSVERPFLELRPVDRPEESPRSA